MYALRCVLKRLYSYPFRVFSSQSLLNVNTNVAKDVILFKYDNPTYFKYLSLFGLSQFGFWVYLSHFSYTTMRDAPVPEGKTEDLPWWRRMNLGEQKYKNTIAFSSALLGNMFLFAAYSYTVRSVRYLILRKGGKTLSFVTYGPFGTKNLIMDVPVNCVSAAGSRGTSKVTLPLKVKGKWLYYMLDMRGEFRNPTLFDSTAGLQRSLKS